MASASTGRGRAASGAPATSTYSSTRPPSPSPFPAFCSAVTSALASVAHPSDASDGYRFDAAHARLIAQYARPLSYFVITRPPRCRILHFDDEEAVWAELHARLQRLHGMMPSSLHLGPTPDARLLSSALSNEVPLSARIDASAAALSSSSTSSLERGLRSAEVHDTVIRDCLWAERVLPSPDSPIDHLHFPVFLLARLQGQGGHLLRVNCVDDLRHWLLKARQWDRLHRADHRRRTGTADLVREEDELLGQEEVMEGYTLRLLRQALRLHQADPTTRLSAAFHLATRCSRTDAEGRAEEVEVQRRVDYARRIEEESGRMRDIQGKVDSQLRLPLPPLPTQPDAPHPTPPHLLTLVLSELWEWMRIEGLDAAVADDGLSLTPQQRRLWRWLIRLVSRLRAWHIRVVEQLSRWPAHGSEEEEEVQQWQVVFDIIQAMGKVQDSLGSGRPQ